MVPFGQPSDRTGGASSALAATGISTTTLREELHDQGHRRPQLLEKHLLFLVTVGHGTYEMDFRPHQCRPGSLLWSRPGQVVRYGGQPGLDAILVRWPPGLLSGLVPDGTLTGPGYWQLVGEDEDAVINEVSQLVVDCRRHRSDDRGAELLRHQLAVLLHRLALLPSSGRPPGTTPPGTDPPGTTATTIDSGLSPTGPSPAGPAVVGGADPARGAARATYQRLRREIERSYRHTRRVEDYAARLECSVRTLTRACLATTGRSAKQVIDDRVTLQAMRLLAATELPVAEVGDQLGFSEPTNFGRFFHREVGLSPGAFRSHMRNGRRS